MPGKLFYSAAAVAIIGVLVQQLGFLDGANFHYYENLWWPDGLRKKRAHKETSVAEPLYAILAMSTSKDFGAHIERLLTAVKKPLDENSSLKSSMAKAAEEYGAPEGAEALSVGLYFDDPIAVDEPRWGMGWAVAIGSFTDLQKIQEQVAASFRSNNHKETVRAVRIGPGPVLKSRIPWRHRFTPMLMPMLQWKKGFEVYDAGKKDGIYQASNGRNNKAEWDAVACEIYVTEKNDKGAYIDYVVLMGDTSDVWDDSFPVIDKELKTEQKETPEAPPVNEDITAEEHVKTD